MKRRIWSGHLPKYWIESPWWGSDGQNLFVLAARPEGRYLSCLNTEGGVLWETPTVSSILLLCHSNGILTSRIRDGRTHAVYHQFQVVEPSTGQLRWGLDSEVGVHLPKGILPVLPLETSPDGPMVWLDAWRLLSTGQALIRDCRPPRFTERKATGVAWGEVALAPPVKGVKGSYAVGATERTSIWARDRFGRDLWTLKFEEQSVITPSERIAGLDVDLQRSGDIPVLAVAVSEGLLVLQQRPGSVALVSWPAQVLLETWESSGLFSLLGEAAGGIIVLQEFEDGMGCLWYVT